MTPLERVTELVKARVKVLERDAPEKRLALECHLACVEVYHRCGQEHPSEYGVGWNAAHLTQVTEGLESELHDLKLWLEETTVMNGGPDKAAPTGVMIYPEADVKPTAIIDRCPSLRDLLAAREGKES